MRQQKIANTLLGTFCILAMCWLTGRSQAAKTVQVHMVITYAALRKDRGPGIMGSVGESTNSVPSVLDDLAKNLIIASEHNGSAT